MDILRTAPPGELPNHLRGLAQLFMSTVGDAAAEADPADARRARLLACGVPVETIEEYDLAQADVEQAEWSFEDQERLQVELPPPFPEIAVTWTRKVSWTNTTSCRHLRAFHRVQHARGRSRRVRSTSGRRTAASRRSSDDPSGEPPPRERLLRDLALLPEALLDRDFLVALIDRALRETEGAS